jgi:hypothetical protein
MAPVSRLTVVLGWWARPRAAMRIHAPLSRSPCHPQAGHLAHFHPGTAGWSGALQWRNGDRQRGQFLEAPRAGTVTTAMPCSAAMCRSRSMIWPRTVCDRRVLRLRPMPRASIDRKSST